MTQKHTTVDFDSVSIKCCGGIVGEARALQSKVAANRGSCESNFVTGDAIFAQEQVTLDLCAVTVQTL